MILLVSATFPPEQVVAAQLAKDLAEYLSDSYKIRVLSPRPSRPLGFKFTSKPLCTDKYEHIVLDSFIYPKSRMIGRILEGISFGLLVARHIKKNRFSIDCCYVSTWPMISQFIIVRILKKYSIQSVMHIQDIYPESMIYRFPLNRKIVKKLLLPLDKYILRNSSAVIAISENMCDTFIETRGIQREKITIVQNWKNEVEFNLSDNLRAEPWREKAGRNCFVFMYLGNIGLVAGVEHLIRSFVRSGLNCSRLIIAGCGPAKEDCIKLAESLNTVNISFWNVPEGEEMAVQSVADVMLLPVRCGGAMSSVPSKLLGYMFSRKPVLACVDSGSDTAKALKDSCCGWVVPPENEEALSTMMKKVSAELPVVLEAYGKRGFDFAVKNYSVRNNLPKLASVITGLARNT